jgi:hypothetical protein
VRQLAVVDPQLDLVLETVELGQRVEGPQCRLACLTGVRQRAAEALTRHVGDDRQRLTPDLVGIGGACEPAAQAEHASQRLGLGGDPATGELRQRPRLGREALDAVGLASRVREHASRLRRDLVPVDGRIVRVDLHPDRRGEGPQRALGGADRSAVASFVCPLEPVDEHVARVDPALDVGPRVTRLRPHAGLG